MFWVSIHSQVAHTSSLNVMSRETSVSDKNECEAVKISHRSSTPHHKANTFGNQHSDKTSRIMAWYNYSEPVGKSSEHIR